MSDLLLNNTTNPGTPASSKARYWTNSTTKRLNYTDDAGTTGQVGVSPYYYDVTDYGVLTTNTAATNNTNMTALFAIAPAGSEIHFPDGTFLFSATWNGGVALPTNYIFTGVRGGTSLTWNANVAGDLIKTTTGGYYTEFRDMQFTTTVAQTAGYVIHFGDGAVGPCVRNVIFAGQSGTATLAGLMSFDNAGSQGSNSGNETYIYDILASNFTGIGINLNSNLVQMVVKGAVMNGKTAASAHATSCITVISCGYIQLDNCDLIGAVNNLNISPTVGLVAASIFANNTFFDQSTGSSLKISGAGTVVRAHFIGCWFTLDPGATSQLGIEISTSGGSTHQGIVFEACKIYNTPAAATATGFSATAVGDVTISDCVIAGWTTGVSITPASPNGTTVLNMTGNTVGPSGGVAANTTGIVLAAGAVQYGSVSVQDNVLSGNTTPLTDASTVAVAANKAITGNIGLANVGVVPTIVTAAQSLTASAANLITGTSIQLPTSGLLVGNKFRFDITTIKTTAAGAATWAAAIKYGTNNTTADAAIATFTSGTNTAAIDTAQFSLILEVTALGASATNKSMCLYIHLLAAATGLSTLPVAGTPATFNSTATTPWLHVDITPGAAAVQTAWGIGYQIA